MDGDNSPATEVKEQLISSFTEITSSSREEARTFLVANEWNLDDAVSNFYENEVPVASAEPNTNVLNLRDQPRNRLLKLRVKYPGISGGAASGADKEAESSEIVDEDVDENDEEDWDESSGTKYRSLEDIMASTPLVKMSNVTIWKNGYTIDNGLLKKLDNPEDAEALEIIEGLESPRKQYSPNGKTVYYRTIIRRQEVDFIEAQVVIDPALPTTTIEIRFGFGSPIGSRFNTHHTIRDIRGLIDVSRPDASRDYQLFSSETLPPTPLTDLDLTIEEAGIAGSLLIHYQN